MQHYTTKVSVTYGLLKQQRNQFLKNTVFWNVTLCSRTRRPNKRCYTLREAVGVGTFLPDYMELEAIRRGYPSQNEQCENPESHTPESAYHFHDDVSYSRFFILNRLMTHIMNNSM
jgi:hypothetical protein